MTAKRVLVRPQGLRPRARAPTWHPLATPLYEQLKVVWTMLKFEVVEVALSVDFAASK